MKTKRIAIKFAENSNVFKARFGTIHEVDTQPILLQEKTVTPTEQAQEITADEGYDALKLVTVEKIPGEYIKPYGTKKITENGTHNVREYENAEIDVPVPDGYIIPTGTKEITENGEHDVKSFEKAKVNIPSYIPNIQQLSITENGTYTASGGIDGYSPVIVNVDQGRDIVAVSIREV